MGQKERERQKITFLFLRSLWLGVRFTIAKDVREQPFFIAVCSERILKI
jgi:hypothetical protein